MIWVYAITKIFGSIFVCGMLFGAGIWALDGEYRMTGFLIGVAVCLVAIYFVIRAMFFTARFDKWGL